MFIRSFIITFILTEIASVAGKSHNPVILILGVIFAYYLLVIRCPFYPYISPDTNEEDN